MAATQRIELLEIVKLTYSHDSIYFKIHKIRKGERVVNFYSIRELRNETKSICENVRKSGEAVITNNGKPTMLMLDISEGNLEETMRAIRQARAMIAFNSMREVAAANGYMSEEEIDAEINLTRAERREKI